MISLEEIKERLIAGGHITRDEAAELASWLDLDELCDAADAVTRALQPDRVDSCSIVNARSGLCGENCKWCAQSVHYSTGCERYPSLPYERVLEAARHNEREGIRRFSLVTSGRAVAGAELDTFCDQFKRLSEDTGLYLCASMGLLDRDAMRRLAEAGVKRYHCNMETSDKVFRRLCSTHTPDDKRRTIAYAREAGMDVCSGGIIGMGETMDDRIDFAFELADLNPDSVPINILNPIPGTPLESTPPYKRGRDNQDSGGLPLRAPEAEHPLRRRAYAAVGKLDGAHDARRGKRSAYGRHADHRQQSDRR